MKRYDSTLLQDRYDGKRVYKTTLYPSIPPSISDIQIICDESDFLDTLAHKYYGDPSLWVFIAVANPGIGKGRLSIPGGTILRIPTNIHEIIQKFNKLNNRN